MFSKKNVFKKRSLKIKKTDALENLFSLFCSSFLVKQLIVCEINGKLSVKNHNGKEIFTISYAKKKKVFAGSGFCFCVEVAGKKRLFSLRHRERVAKYVQTNLA